MARGMRRYTAPSPWVSNLIITVTGRELEQSVFEFYDLLSSDGQNTLEDEVVGSTPTHGIRIQYYVSASRLARVEWVRSGVRVPQQVFVITV